MTGIIVAGVAFVAFVVGCIVGVVRAGIVVGQVKAEIASDESKSGYGRMDGAVNAAIDEEEGKPRNLLVKTLQDMGCQCRTDDHDRIEFKYQGETFVADAHNDKFFIWIYDYAWTGFELDDPDAEPELLKQAVNETNKNNFATTLYITDQERRVMVVYSHGAFYFSRDIAKPQDYLCAILDSFFQAHQSLNDELNKLMNGREQRERTVVKGFSQDAPGLPQDAQASDEVDK